MPKKEKTQIATLVTQTDLQATQVFEESWTGNEDPRAFSNHAGDVEGYLTLGLGCLLLGGLAKDWEGNTSGEAVAYGLGGLTVLIDLNELDTVWLPRALRKNMRARTLRIDRDGITTTDSSGVQHIPWTAIGKLAVRNTDTAIRNYRPLALHLQMHQPKPKAPTVLHRPAGWPTYADLPPVCRGPQAPAWNDWVPVCVLGPLPGPRRLELKNAVAAYAKHPLETEENW